jgi:RHH-type rel operon transcriptional repressor/antitoxin RelB
MPTSIRLAPETDQRLERLAAETGRSKAYYLREMIERGLEEMEDYYLAAEVLERIRKGEESVHSLAEVERDWAAAAPSAKAAAAALERLLAHRIKLPEGAPNSVELLDLIYDQPDV